MNSFIDGSAFCPGAPKRVRSDSEKHLRLYTSSHVCHSHEWRVDTATGKNGMRVKTSADQVDISPSMSTSSHDLWHPNHDATSTKTVLLHNAWRSVTFPTSDTPDDSVPRQSLFLLEWICAHSKWMRLRRWSSMTHTLARYGRSRAYLWSSAAPCLCCCVSTAYICRCTPCLCAIFEMGEA